MAKPEGLAHSKLDIDLRELETLAGYQMSQRNMAGWFGVSVPHFEDILRYSQVHRDAYEKGRAKVVVAVIQKQVERALGTGEDAAVDQRALDACSKNLCGWGEKIDVRTGDIDENDDPLSELIAKLDEVEDRRAGTG